MRVREIMTANPVCCTPDTSLQEIAQLMRDHDCGCIPVVDNQSNKKPVGTITDRDITIRAFTGGQSPLEMKASDIMTTEVISITPEMSIEECSNVMQDRNIRRVLVVDEKGSCCGIVAQADIAQHAPHHTAEVVRDISTSSPSQTTRGFSSFANSGASRSTSSQSYSGKASLLNTDAMLSFAGGMAAGAALMYFMDTEKGRTRRTMVTDKVTSLANTTQETLSKTGRDLSNRAQGVFTETRNTIAGDRESSEQNNESTFDFPKSRTATQS